ncbi:hypothetical protein FB388_0243 [Pseudonocardia cypriaca]|uniref:Uncharacterized protein n=1 Tax=Pseudonocardia cypriaca TaxID=882449 RepID=A0A543G9Z1_9PSEU|nr:hypothetical protein FB388_0243 [Pseudonocardia cypriaca]
MRPRDVSMATFMTSRVMKVAMLTLGEVCP